MPCIHKNLFLLMIFLLSALTAACEPLLTPVYKVGKAPTPIMQFEAAGTDDPNIFVDQQPFQAALLQAIQNRDEVKLRRMMANPFTSGLWRGEMRDLAPSDALRELYETQPGEEIKLALAPNVDLSARMGGISPIDILRPEANVVGTIVVTGWGKDGQDSAVLFVSRQTNNALLWAGVLVVKDGFP